MTDWNQYFEQAQAYEPFLEQYAKPAERQRWDEMYERIALQPAQIEMLGGWVRQIRVLCMAGTWCGDCVQQCPIFQRFVEACPVLDVRYVDRDAGPWKEELTICGGSRVPQTVYLSEEGLIVGRGGDRTLSKYRQMAASQLGTTCPTGIGAPPTELTNAVVQDWLNELERVHWILRLSPRLREKHGD